MAAPRPDTIGRNQVACVGRPAAIVLSVDFDGQIHVVCERGGCRILFLSKLGNRQRRRNQLIHEPPTAAPYARGTRRRNPFARAAGGSKSPGRRLPCEFESRPRHYPATTEQALEQAFERALEQALA